MPDDDKTKNRLRTACEVCSAHIHLMVYKGTGVCSQRCEKASKGEK